jgi:hypothetical protein
MSKEVGLKDQKEQYIHKEQNGRQACGPHVQFWY